MRDLILLASILHCQGVKRRFGSYRNVQQLYLGRSRAGRVLQGQTCLNLCLIKSLGVGICPI